MATIKTTSKSYIGCTTKTLTQRKYVHHRDAKLGGRNPFHRAIIKYGKTAVIWVVLENGILDWDTLVEREKYWIKEKNTFRPNGYNLTLGGEGAYGHVVSEEARKMMGVANIGRVAWNKGVSPSKETRKKISVANIGKHNNPWNKGRHLSEVVRHKISESGKGRKAWNKGISTGPLSEETKRRLSLAHRGRIASEETRGKIRESRIGERHSVATKLKISKSRKGYSAWNKGIPCSKKTKEKLRVANLGRKQSLATCRKISRALKGRPGGMKGKHHSTAARKRISAALKGIKRVWPKKEI